MSKLKYSLELTVDDRGNFVPKLAKMQAGIDKVKGSTVRATTKTQRFSKTWKKFNAVGRKTSSVLFSMRSAIAGIGIVAFTRSLLRAQYQLERIGVQFKTVFGSKAAATQMNYVKKQADYMGLSFLSLATGYAKLSAATMFSPTLRGGNTKKIFEGLNTLNLVFKLTKQQQELTMYAVVQSLSKGIVRAEEFKRQLGDHIPNAVALGAKSMGLSITDFLKTMEAGAIKSESFWVSFAKTVEREYMSGIQIARRSNIASLMRLQNAWTDTMVDLKSDGMLDSWTTAIDEVTAKLKSTDMKEAMTGFAEMFKSGVIFALEMGKMMNHPYFKNIAGAMTGAMVGGMVAGPYGALAGGIGGALYPDVNYRNEDKIKQYEKQINPLQAQIRSGIKSSSRLGVVRLSDQEKQDLKDKIKSLQLLKKSIKELAQLEQNQLWTKNNTPKHQTKNQFMDTILDAKKEAMEAERKALFEKQNEGYLGSQDGLKQWAEKSKDTFKMFSDTAAKAMQSFEDSMVKAVMTGKFLFKDFANAVIADLIRIQIRKSITLPMSTALSAGIGAMFGGGASPTSFTGKPGYADGGLANSGYIGSTAGSARSDSQFIRVSGAEFMVNARATAKHMPLLEQINNGTFKRFATGGAVNGARSYSTDGRDIQVNVNVKDSTGGGVKFTALKPVKRNDGGFDIELLAQVVTGINANKASRSEDPYQEVIASNAGLALDGGAW